MRKIIRAFVVCKQNRKVFSRQGSTIMKSIIDFKTKVHWSAILFSYWYTILLLKTPFSSLGLLHKKRPQCGLCYKSARKTRNRINLSLQYAHNICPNRPRREKIRFCCMRTTKPLCSLINAFVIPYRDRMESLFGPRREKPCLRGF